MHFHHSFVYERTISRELQDWRRQVGLMVAERFDFAFQVHGNAGAHAPLIDLLFSRRWLEVRFGARVGILGRPEQPELLARYAGGRRLAWVYCASSGRQVTSSGSPHSTLLQAQFHRLLCANNNQSLLPVKQMDFLNWQPS
jgi:hypothetical protein